MSRTHFFRCLIAIGFFISVLWQSGVLAETVQQKIIESKPEEIKKPERDPMWPVSMALFEPVKQKQAPTQKKQAPYRVQGKGRSSKGSYVVIGGNVIREGETKGEITVVKIGEVKVDILVNGIPESLPIE